MTDGPLPAYRAKCEAGEIDPDPMQRLAAEKLQALHRRIAHYEPQEPKKKGWRHRLGFGGNKKDGEAPNVPTGLYLFGGAGRGKSMLMDLFFETATIEKKRRVHFHEFMLEVHDRLHIWRKERSSEEARARGQNIADPMPILAKDLINQCWLLCFDEFHVVDVADAMILGRLFEALFDRGMVVVATSNWAPDDLYKDGLQRQRFLPFIDLLKQRMDILHLSGSQDYRLLGMAGEQVYFTPLNGASEQAMARAFAKMTEDAEPKPDELILKGRTLEVPRSARGVAWFSFEELCARPLGAADYLALATHYSAILLEGVPQLKPEHRNEAKRLIVLIDALYEHRTKLVVSAEVPADQLYLEGTGAGVEFDRTVSRLTEMQSADYFTVEHLM
ncbi:MAG: cell division protein ZapE [Pseudomonadota bacterium]